MVTLVRTDGLTASVNINVLTGKGGRIKKKKKGSQDSTAHLPVTVQVSFPAGTLACMLVVRDLRGVKKNK